MELLCLKHFLCDALQWSLEIRDIFHKGFLFNFFRRADCPPRPCPLYRGAFFNQRAAPVPRKCPGHLPPAPNMLPPSLAQREPTPPLPLRLRRGLGSPWSRVSLVLIRGRLLCPLSPHSMCLEHGWSGAAGPTTHWGRGSSRVSGTQTIQGTARNQSLTDAACCGFFVPSAASTVPAHMHSGWATLEGAGLDANKTHGWRLAAREVSFPTKSPKSTWRTHLLTVTWGPSPASLAVQVSAWGHPCALKGTQAQLMGGPGQPGTRTILHGPSPGRWQMRRDPLPPFGKEPALQERALEHPRCHHLWRLLGSVMPAPTRSTNSSVLSSQFTTSDPGQPLYS